MAGTLLETLPQISHGDHCCLFFSSLEEQARITSHFLAIGLERGERCVYVGDANSIDNVRNGLKNVGVDVGKEATKKRLLMTHEREYLHDGHWKTEKMLGFLQTAYDSTLSDGFTALRAAGDVSWQVGPDNDFRDVVYYEALLDLFFIGKRMIGMCQYPKTKCPPETLKGILETHKIAAVDSSVCSNFHYVPQELLLEKNPDAREQKRVQWMTSQLLRVQKAEAERDVLQQQLIQSQKMEAVGRLAGGVAHDFNNILTAILGFSQFVLVREGLDDEVRNDVKEINAASERAAALTRQLLAFSRKQTYQPRVINLNSIIGSMEKFLRRIIREDIELKTVLGTDLGNVLADPGLLEQVLLNLVVNARDAMPQGGRLTVEAREVELGEDYAQAHPEIKPGPHIMLAVGDTGHGMDPATQSRLFEPFFTTKEKGKGTGLGLSTVQGIVKQSGGSIYVYSEPGKGSVFKVYLPRIDGKAENAQAPVVRIESLRGTETVLLVEDDDVVRKLAHRTLAEQGHTVLTVISAHEGIRFCERYKEPIHLLITDAVLPGMAGRELVKQIGPLRPKMKILYMSGYTDEVAVHQGMVDPAHAFIEKPFTPEALIRKVREVLSS